MQDLLDSAARNVEIKARIDDVRSLASKAAAIATEGPVELLQDDAFFHCARGRLKLRVSPGADAELIFYRRADARGPRESFYLRVPVSAPDELRSALSLACGPMGWRL